MPLVALAIACSAPGSGPAGGAVAGSHPDDPAVVEHGRRLFLGACAGYCHATSDGGRGEAPDLWDCEWIHGGDDADVFATIARGVPGTPMVAFGESLADRDIWSLVSYLRHASQCR